MCCEIPLKGKRLAEHYRISVPFAMFNKRVHLIPNRVCKIIRQLGVFNNDARKAKILSGTAQMTSIQNFA